MQGLGCFSSVYVWERLIWMARPFYHFLFLENSNLKIYSFSKDTFIKGALLFFNQPPPAPHFDLWGKARLLDWGRTQMGRVGVKPEIEHVPPGPVWRWFAFQTWCVGRAEGQPDTSVFSQPRPFGAPDGAGSAVFKGALPESVSSGIPEWIITKRPDNSWLCKPVKQWVFFLLN